MYIYVPNPLFQTLSTTAVIFFDLHKAPAQFRRSRGNNFPLSSVPIWSYGITFTWPFLDVPPFFCSGRMRSAVLKWPRDACIYTALQYHDMIGTKKFDQLCSRIRLTCLTVYLVSFRTRTEIYLRGPRRLVYQPSCRYQGW